MNDLYHFVKTYIETDFDEVAVLHETSRGSVIRLRHRDSRKLYICRHFQGSASAYQRLLHIRCEHLPRIYEAVQNDREALVLEEYIQGDTLFSVLQGGVLTSEETRAITFQLCDALYALHSLGLVHRDIKPENVLLNGSRAVLIDFDAMRENKPDQSQDTQVLGTQGYAAPEQYGIAQTDQRADLYALGVLINVMLTRKHPSIELAPGKWGRIVQKCTQVNPRKRYRTVRALMEAL